MSAVTVTPTFLATELPASQDPMQHPNTFLDTFLDVILVLTYLHSHTAYVTYLVPQQSAVL